MLENVHAPKCIHAFNTKNNFLFLQKIRAEEDWWGPTAT